MELMSTICAMVFQEGTRRTMGRRPTKGEMTAWVPASAFFKSLEPFPLLSAPT